MKPGFAFFSFNKASTLQNIFLILKNKKALFIMIFLFEFFLQRIEKNLITFINNYLNKIKDFKFCD